MKSVVNVHKETIRLEADEASPDCVLVCFTFDAAVDGWYMVSFITFQLFNVDHSNKNVIFLFLFLGLCEFGGDRLLIDQF